MRAGSDQPGAVWRGQTDVIRRLIKGADLDLVAHIAEEQGLRDEPTGDQGK